MKRFLERVPKPRKQVISPAVGWHERRFLDRLSNILTLASLLLMTGVFSGCAHDAKTPQTPASPKSASSDATAESEQTNASGIQLVQADMEKYQQTLDKYRGKVVLVDFWATWCVPCKKFLPKILHYGGKYADQGLVVITVSMDDDSDQENALSFLRSVNAKVDNLISKWGAGTESTEKFGIDSALPYYKLYDRQGKLRYQFSGQFEGLDNIESLERIEPRVQELLEEAPE